MAAVLAKLHTLRKEHAEAPKDTKDSLTRVESALAEVVERMTKLELMLASHENKPLWAVLRTLISGYVALKARVGGSYLTCKIMLHMIQGDLRLYKHFGFRRCI